MSERKKLKENVFQYLIYLFDTSSTYDIHELLTHSKIEVQADIRTFTAQGAHKLFITVNPEIFKKYQGELKQFRRSISDKFHDFTNVPISHVDISPDLEKFQIIENRIVPIHTEWENINKKQDHLIELLRTAKEKVDYQNIGNTARSLLKEVANLVFDIQKHSPAEKEVKLDKDKYKNRLHSYIIAELGEKENKELRDYALSVITTSKKSINLANKLTHDEEASQMMAESCVISTITVIGIIRLIES